MAIPSTGSTTDFNPSARSETNQGRNRTARSSEKPSPAGLALSDGGARISSLEHLEASFVAKGARLHEQDAGCVAADPEAVARDPRGGQVDAVVVVVARVDHVPRRVGRQGRGRGDVGKCRAHEDRAGQPELVAAGLAEQAEELDGGNRGQVGIDQVVVDRGRRGRRLWGCRRETAGGGGRYPRLSKMLPWLMVRS